MTEKENDGLTIPIKYATIIVSTLLSGVIAFNTWTVSALYARPTEDHVKELIGDKSPYAKDRAMILSMLQDIREDIDELKQMLRKE